LGLAFVGVPLSDEWVQQDPVGVAARASVGRIIEQSGGDDGEIPAGLQAAGPG
jgi:hypothetical protein